MAIAWLACGPQGVRRTVKQAPDAEAEDGGSGGSDTGGRPGTGGRATGGSPGTGGSPATGGSPGTGGAPATGGSPGAGGSPGTGGMMPPPPDAAPDLAPDTAPVPETCTMGMAGAYMNTPMPSQTGTFTVRFSITSSTAPTNGLVGLSMGAATGFAGYVANLRFNPMGTIDAINGANYDASPALPYTANAVYQIKLTVNVAAHTYSAFVTPPGGTETRIGNDFAFRTQTVTRLDSWGVAMQSMATGSVKACGFAIE